MTFSKSYLSLAGYCCWLIAGLESIASMRKRKCTRCLKEAASKFSFHWKIATNRVKLSREKKALSALAGV
jgi:hypothetical protein